MSPKIVCLITFDYELSLGRNFLPPEKVLIEPTRQVLEICDKLSLPVTFFPDVCCAWTYRKYGFDEFANSFEKQMIDAISLGHGVELHLHPHWLNTIFEKGQWLISTEKMYLHELGYGPGADSANTLIFRGVKYLNDLLQTAKPEYRCRAFRAAGSALQPDEKKLIAALMENGIELDVSVTKFLTLNLDTVKINYTNVPPKSLWYMSPETGIAVEGNNGILEIPIGTFRTGWGQRAGFLWRRAGSLKQMRGTTISRKRKQSKLANIHTLLLQNLRYVIGNPWFIISCDTKGFDSEMLLDGFNQYVNRHKTENTIYVTMMNHPKLMFDYQLDLLAEFVTETRKRYDITFCTCSEVLDKYRPE